MQYGQLDITENHSIKEKFGAVIKEMEAEMRPQAVKQADYKQYPDFGFNLLRNIDRMYVSGNTRLKSQIPSSVLPKSWSLKENHIKLLSIIRPLPSYSIPARVLEEIKKDKLFFQKICPLL